VNLRIEGRTEPGTNKGLPCHQHLHWKPPHWLVPPRTEAYYGAGMTSGSLVLEPVGCDIACPGASATLTTGSVQLCMLGSRHGYKEAGA
jgi:hypothetical protein